MDGFQKEKRKQEKPPLTLQKSPYPLNTKVDAIYSICLCRLKKEKEVSMDLCACICDVCSNLFGFNDDNTLKGSLHQK